LRRDLVAVCHQSLDSFALRTKALELLTAAMPVDGAFFATADPVTLLHTTAVSVGIPDELTPRFLHNEFVEPDVNKFRVLARARVPVDRLERATSGDLFRSPRYAEILRPIGLGDELRATVRTRNTCWGFVCLHRADTAKPFSPTEADFLAGLVPHLAEGLRRSVVAEAAAAVSADDGPGVALIDEDGAVMSATPAAVRWLAELSETDRPRPRLPIAVLSVLERLRALADDEAADDVMPRLTARTAAGRWVVLHASQLVSKSDERKQATVVIEPAGPLQLADRIVATYGWTPRESEIAERLLRGLSVKRIATDCRISHHTVREHCKAVFDKAGVSSRGELMASVYRVGSPPPSPRRSGSAGGGPAFADASDVHAFGRR
jgi:DNA-binding CsgD family transcriptional regulator